MSFKDTAGHALLHTTITASGYLRDLLESGAEPEVKEKEGYAPGSADITTDHDGGVDAMYRATLLGVGPVQSEDGEQYKEPAMIPNMRFVVDAVDGTRSLAAGMHAQVGSMGAAINCQEAFAAFVCSVMTGEIIGFDRADESGGHMLDYSIDRNGEPTRKLLSIGHLTGCRAAGLPVQVRRSGSGRIRYTSFMERLLEPGRVFKEEQLVKGSFGVGMFPLWRGEVAAQVIPGSYYETPWDNTPVFAICQKLGIQALTFDRDGQLVPFEMTFLKVKRLGTEILLVHKAFAAEVMQAAAQLA